MPIVDREDEHSPFRTKKNTLMGALMSLVVEEIKFRAKMMEKVLPLSHSAKQHLSIIYQQFWGHITVSPDPPIYEYFMILKNPTHGEVLRKSLEMEKQAFVSSLLNRV